MDTWTLGALKRVVCNWDSLDGSRAGDFLAVMNGRFPPGVFEAHLAMRRRALDNAAASRSLLDGAEQSFPDVVDYRSLERPGRPLGGMAGFAIVFTAGGEGERLRLSLLERGASEESLRDFTKATYPLKGFNGDFGALQINLAMVAALCERRSIDIPVIVTTGPKGSVTERVIPEVLRRHGNFGLPHVAVIPQGERLHFTADERIAVRLTDGNPYPVTQPDETGGPLVGLKGAAGTGYGGARGQSALRWLAGLGCGKLLIVQGTAVYEPKMLSYICAAAEGRDCVGVGIPRAAFEAGDPFGTFVCVSRGGERRVRIVEQDIRNDGTRSVRDGNTGAYLPFNTGLYAVDREFLESAELPDYATPPKEVLPGLARSPKIGYAATDIFPLAERPVVLTVDAGMYAVIKTADDLESLADTARRFGLPEAAGL